MSLLENIHGHEDLLALDAEGRKLLCKEIRSFLIEHVSKTGGHVASNMGVVELTVAIETVYNTAKDRLIFDVGHQSYTHKILTGRQKEFESLRQFGGIAGFPKPSESDTDAFIAGHASSSVSIALGMARARTLQKEDYDIITVLGDGAATGGIAYEGLNDAAVSGEPMVIILNDNTLSIDRNVGGMASHLQKLRTKERYLGMKARYRSVLLKIPGGKPVYRWLGRVKDKLRRMLIPTSLFENMGFTYLGPVDGHDTEHLIFLLKAAREKKRPVVLHVITQKGRGYKHSEEHPKLFHGVGKFDPESGEILQNNVQTYSAAFGDTMVELAEMDARVCAITAAMPGGTGLLEFKQKYPKRLFDVGIAEEHAVSMAAGLAKQGMVPVVAIYSTFLQRAYDMILQDVGILGQHVVFAVDRAGLVGEDGETHHGVFDVGYLRHCPGMKVLCPASTRELTDMLKWAVEDQCGPVAIRYPRGCNNDYEGSAWDVSSGALAKGRLHVHRTGTNAMIITYGSLLQNAMDAAVILEEQGVHTGVIRLLSVSPLPAEETAQLVSGCNHVVVLEACTSNAGVHGELLSVIQKHNPGIRVDAVNLGNRYATHGSIMQLYRFYGLDAASIAGFIMEVRQSEN